MKRSNDETSKKLARYTNLIDRYLSGKLNVLDFEKEYLKMFKDDQTPWDGEEFDILNGLFIDIDAFCYDSTIRTLQDLDETQLKIRTMDAAKKLKSLKGSVGQEF